MRKAAVRFMLGVLVNGDGQTGGVVAREQVAGLEAEAEKEGRDIMRLLLERGLVKQADIGRAKAALYGSEFLHLTEGGKVKEILEEAIGLITPEEANGYMAIPLERRGRKVTVAMIDAGDVSTVDGLTTLLHRRNEDITEVIAAGAPEADIKEALQRYYPIDATLEEADAE